MPKKLLLAPVLITQKLEVIFSKTLITRLDFAGISLYNTNFKSKPNLLNYIDTEVLSLRFKFCFLLLVFIFFVPQVTLAGSINTNHLHADSPLLKKFLTPTTDEVAPKLELANLRWVINQGSGNTPTRLRLVIDTTGPVKVTNKLDDTNSLIVLDIPETSVGKIDNKVSLDGEIADQVTFTPLGTTGSRVIISLSGVIDESDYTVFTLPSDPDNGKMFRVVIDINKPLPQPDYTFTPGLQHKIIVIDPGHGGSDSGAIGPNQTQEKDLTLAVSKKVQTLLEKAGAQVVMTRDDDTDVYGPNASAVNELKARTLVGSDNNADVFVSIHINAFSNPTAGGTATYYYPKSKYDSMLAQAIQNRLAIATGLQNRGKQPANFYVMKRSTMPAILTELAFISNPKEEELLNLPQFQQQMAQGIVQGLDDFFKKASKK